MSDFSFVETGLDAAPEERPESRDDYGVRRFYLKGGTKCDIAILSAPHQFGKIREHEVWVGKRPTFLTCCQTDKVDCPLCEAAVERDDKKLKCREIWYGTLLNQTGYVNKEGKRVNNYKELLGLNFSSRDKLLKTMEMLAEKDLDIYGAKFTVSRSEAKTAYKTGDNWQYWSHIDFKAMEKEGIDVAPIMIVELEEFKPDYDKCLAVAEAVKDTPVRDFSSQL